MISTPVALISGSSRGLGQAMALAFAKKKYAVAVHGFRNEKAAQETAQTIKAEGGKALVMTGDVRSSKDVQRMFETVEEEWGRINVLVNNAGFSRDRTISKMTDEEWQDVVAVHLNGAFFCSRAALPLMRRQKEGCIINMSSYLAFRPAIGAANYAAAKAGVIAFTKALALEEGRFNIRANAILPGFHVTDMNKEVWRKYEPEIRGEHALERMPTRESMGEFVVSVAELKSVSGQVFAFESRLL